MIDVSPKFLTLRFAKATGFIRMDQATLKRVLERSVPKGDVREVARAGGIAAAKRTSDWIVFCHPIPLDWVEVFFEPEETGVRVTAEVKSVWKTGVEMEALTAVQAALLNMYDMLKPLTDDMEMTGIHLVKKSGGKSHFVDEFENPVSVAVLVISDSTFSGKREDKSGKAICTFLENQPVDVKVYDILPDDEERIRDQVRQLVDDEEIQLVITTGGTGLGPRDITPEAIRPLLQKELPGVVEAVRKHGKDRTPYAMLSREIAGLRKQSIIVTLPGSSRGAKESMEAMFPGLLHGFPMIWGGGHGPGEKKGGPR